MALSFVKESLPHRHVVVKFYSGLFSGESSHDVIKRKRNDIRRSSVSAEFLEVFLDGREPPAGGFNLNKDERRGEGYQVRKSPKMIYILEEGVTPARACSLDLANGKTLELQVLDYLKLDPFLRLVASCRHAFSSKIFVK